MGGEHHEMSCRCADCRGRKGEMLQWEERQRIVAFLRRADTVDPGMASAWEEAANRIERLDE
jgi:hypothetical protein